MYTKYIGTALLNVDTLRALNWEAIGIFSLLVPRANFIYILWAAHVYDVIRPCCEDVLKRVPVSPFILCRQQTDVAANNSDNH